MSFKQREHYRVPIEVPVAIKLNGDTLVDATCHDISMGGMGLLLNSEIEPKSCGLVTMRYEQQGSKILFSAKFSVAWAHHQDANDSRKRAGIQFIEIDESNKTNLAQILLKRMLEMEDLSIETH
jgi:c-di-GMP-binding flagellar brake protein YcgR